MADDEAQLTARRSGLIAASIYHHGARIADNVGVEGCGGWAAQADHVVWIGLLEPSDALLHKVQQEFGLNDLAIEDAAQAHQRPKLQRYGDSLFVVARTAEMVGDRIAFGETHLFVGCGYVVSIRHGPSTSYGKVRAHAEASPNLLKQGEAFILHSILDFIVDNYQAVIERVQDEAEEIENDLLAERLTPAQVKRLYILRRDLLRLRTGVGPLVELCRRLEHNDLLRMDAPMELLFRDVTDHVRSAQEEIDALREMLSFCFDASVQTSQSQQTIISRQLAAWAAILAVPTAVAGIYGMNFENMPELHVQNAYYFVIAFVVVACLALYANFRRIGWL